MPPEQRGETAKAAALYFVRPRGAGRVYHYRSDQYGLSGSTALLLRTRDCLVLSRSEADIGKAEATVGSSGLFVIARTDRIRSGRAKSGAYLVDTENGLLARPGDAIDGEVLYRPRAGNFEDILAAGWPISDRCGGGLAIVFSIARVHR